MRDGQTRLRRETVAAISRRVKYSDGQAMQTNRVPYRRQTWRQGRRRGASRARPQVHERFDVMRLRKQVKGFDGRDFVTRRVWLGARRHAFGLEQHREIPRERRGVAGQIDHFRRLDFGEFPRGGLAEPGTWRIKYDQVRLLVKFL